MIPEVPLTPQGLKGPDAAMFLNILDYALILMRGIIGMHESLSNGKKRDLFSLGFVNNRVAFLV